MKHVSCVKIFSILGNERRLAVLHFLLHHGSSSVSQIAEELNHEQSALSHNLKELLECHFVTVEQKGKERIYTVNKETIEPMLTLAERHIKRFCKDSDHHH